MYSINFTATNKKFCLSLHYNGANSDLFVNGTEIYKFKAKESKISLSKICLWNISKDWSVNNMKRTELTGYVYDFSVDCYNISIDDIKDINIWWKKIIWYDMICLKTIFTNQHIKNVCIF